MGFFSGPKMVTPDIGKLTDKGVNAIGANWPELLATLQSGQAGQAQLQTDIAKSQSPQLNDLMMQLFSKYAPQLNAVGNQINAQNVASQADIAAGPGKDLLAAILGNSQMMDPEFFATRAATSDRIGDLLGSIKLGAELSGGERSEIERGLNVEGMRRGTGNAPSNLDTVGNAMVYGGAARQREMQNQDQLAKAISAATSFLPASRTGFDTASIGTGRDMPNQGANAFVGIQDSGGGKDALQLGQGFSGQVMGMAQTQAQPYMKGPGFGYEVGMDLAKNLNKALGSAAGTGMTAGMAACWVAREVYGINNPDWLQFRYWLMSRSPRWFFNLYLKKGAQFAKFISNKAILKSAVRFAMDAILLRNNLKVN